jgi:hypothetical protein
VADVLAIFRRHGFADASVIGECRAAEAGTLPLVVG